MREGTETEITAYGIPLNAVSSFKYLGRFLSALEYEWTAVVQNIRR